MDSKPINKTQVKLIHIAIAKLNYSDEEYRELLWGRYQVTTSKDLTYEQASDLIDYFKLKGFKIKKKCTLCTPRQWREKLPENIIMLVSKQQLSMIEHLREDVRWHVHDGFQRWLEKRMGIKKVKTSIEANKIIEGLKNMVKAQNKCPSPCALSPEGRGMR